MARIIRAAGGVPRYEVAYYPPTGHGQDYMVSCHHTLTDAREAVRRALGVRALRSSRRWSGKYRWDVEAYHEYTASHPRADGCGGYVIVDRVERDGAA